MSQAPTQGTISVIRAMPGRPDPGESRPDVAPNEAAGTAKAGDTMGDAYDALEQSYEQYRRSILGYIYSRTGSTTVAEELTAEVFARLVDRLDTIRDRGRPLRAWLHVVAHNLVIDYLRRARRLQWLPLDDHIEAEDSAYPPQIVERGFQRESLFAAFRYLTEAQRQVITLKYLEGYSNAETGAILGKDENSVKALQHRALVTLRRVLTTEQSG